MNEFVPFSLAFTGFTALALAMHRHQRQVWHRTLGGGASFLLRMGGAVCLSLSFAGCVLQSGWSIGPVLWFGMLTAAAMAVVLLLTFLPWFTVWAAPVMVLMAGATRIIAIATLR